MNWFQKLLGIKESQARIITSVQSVGRPVHTPANYESFARQGYARNPLVYTCIDKISTAAAGIRWELFNKKGGSQIETHPLLVLLERPNPLQAQSSFFESVVAYYILTGNTYIEANRPFTNRPPLELWPVRPDRMKIIPGANGLPAFYQFSVSGQSKTWEVDPVKLTSDIMHMKTFHPLNDWYGMAPIEAALLSIDQMNAASTWNLALLQNSATPSGVLQMKMSEANPRGELTAEQYARLKAEFETSYTGARNTGKPLILEGGLMWQQIALSPKDADFANGKSLSSLDISMVYGVPPELLGLGQKTFNNYKEARLAFYEETVLPLMDNLRDELNKWLTPAFGDGIYLDYDRDDIEALTYKREQKFSTVQSADFLTQNEKREAVGYEPKDGWDVFVIGGQILASPDDFSDPFAETPPDDETPPGDDEETPPEDDEEIVDEMTDEEIEDEGKKQFKSFNLVNANERRQSWKRQNARRLKHQKSFESDLKEDFVRLAKKLSKAAGVSTDSKLIEFEMLKTANDFMPVISATIERHIDRTVRSFGDLILEEGKSLPGYIETKQNVRFDDFVHRYVEKRTGEAITQIQGTTAKQVRRTVSRLVGEAITEGNTNPDLTKEILNEFTTISAGRARTIARTEVQLASNNGSLEAVKSLQIPNMVKEWVSVQDSRTRDDSETANHLDMNGQVVSLDEKFTVPPDASMEGPGDSSGGASQVINCRCVLTYKSKNPVR